MFNMEISEPTKAAATGAAEEEGNHTKLEDMVRKLHPQYYPIGFLCTVVYFRSVNWPVH